MGGFISHFLHNETEAWVRGTLHGLIKGTQLASNRTLECHNASPLVTRILTLSDKNCDGREMERPLLQDIWEWRISAPYSKNMHHINL